MWVLDFLLTVKKWWTEIRFEWRTCTRWLSCLLSSLNVSLSFSSGHIYLCTSITELLLFIMEDRMVAFFSLPICCTLKRRNGEGVRLSPSSARHFESQLSYFQSAESAVHAGALQWPASSPSLPLTSPTFSKPEATPEVLYSALPCKWVTTCKPPSLSSSSSLIFYGFFSIYTVGT